MVLIVGLCLPPMLAGYLLVQAWDAPEFWVSRWSWVVATSLVFVVAVAEFVGRRIPPEGSLFSLLDHIGGVIVPLTCFFLLVNIISAIWTVLHVPDARAASLLGCAIVFVFACGAFLFGAASGGMIG